MNNDDDGEKGQVPSRKVHQSKRRDSFMKGSLRGGKVLKGQRRRSKIVTPQVRTNSGGGARTNSGGSLGRTGGPIGRTNSGGARGRIGNTQVGLPKPRRGVVGELVNVAPKPRRRGSVADIIGGLQGKKTEPIAMPSVAELQKEMSGKNVNGWQMMSRFLSAVKLMNSSLQDGDADVLADQIIASTCELLECERTTLFLVDADLDEIILVVGRGAANIRLPIGQGIAGHVALTGQTVNIPDPYNDSRFDPSFDKKTGFVTRSILCTAVRDPEGNTVAVLQCINKTNSSFTSADLMLISHLAVHVGIVINNSKLLESQRKIHSKLHSVLGIVRSLHAQSTPHSLMFTISCQIHQIIDADRCTLYLVDHKRQQLVVLQGDVDIRIPMDKGIAGHVATTQKPYLIADAYESPYFSKDIDMQTGYRTKSILAMPIFASATDNQKIVGVLQVINKLDDIGYFTQADHDLMGTLSNIAGPLLAEASQQLLRHGNASAPPDTEMFRKAGESADKDDAARPAFGGMALVEEDEDEEDAF